MLFFYIIFIQLYVLAIRLASSWNKKAAAWLSGRKNLFKELENQIQVSDRIIWVHCSSAGEFEQGKPVINALKQAYPFNKILVSFFSPSGFAVAKNYLPVEYITYLPLDTRHNAQQFLTLVRPELVIFIKYEFWYHHLAAIARQNIPLLLVSAVFRKEQLFFKSYGGFFRRQLFLFRHIFVQDQASLQLLLKAQIAHSSISGDTRFDRVKEIKEQFSEVENIQTFVEGYNTLIAGSTWQEDEKLLQEYLSVNTNNKLIIAPHEINNRHIASLQVLFPAAILYSEITRQTLNSQVLIIDSVGLLSRIYSYATITYIGGGFTKDGIHNILEAAVWAKPVIFGPNYKKYREAGELIAAGGGFSIRSAAELKKLADDFFQNQNHLQAVSEKAKNYIEKNTGATQKIIAMIQENRLLTN